MIVPSYFAASIVYYTELPALFQYKTGHDLGSLDPFHVPNDLLMSNASIVIKDLVSSL